MIAIIPLLMVIVGVLMYALCANPKLAEIGRIMFAAGMFALAFTYAGHTVSVLHS